MAPFIQFKDRVINKETIEKGFHCIPTITKSDGGGEGREHLFEEKLVRYLGPSNYCSGEENF